MEFRYHALDAAEDEKVVKVEREGDHYRVTVGERTYTVEVHRPEHGRLNMKIDGRRVRAYVASDGLRRYVAFDAPCSYVLQQPDPRAGARRRAVQAQAGGLEAAMPGHVLDVLVRAGDTVERGQTLLLLEAMKMELRLAAPSAGTVRRVLCRAGDVVERGQLLLEVEATP